MLVKMLYTEKNVTFKTDCQLYQSSCHYYGLGRLKSCYGYNS